MNMSPAEVKLEDFMNLPQDGEDWYCTECDEFMGVWDPEFPMDPICDDCWSAIVDKAIRLEEESRRQAIWDAEEARHEPGIPF